jgi:Universal stress protein UspA and related nucleotide-binding proteins
MPEIKVIICAVDLSAHSETVAKYAVSFAKSFGAEVHAIYAAPALTQYVGFHVPPSSIEHFVGEIITGAEVSMEKFVAAHLGDVPSKGVVLNGYAAEEIMNYAKANKGDMIIMGTHGRKGFDRILFGSVAEHVVKAATIPVMTIRPGEGYQP